MMADSSGPGFLLFVLCRSGNAKLVKSINPFETLMNGCTLMRSSQVITDVAPRAVQPTPNILTRLLAESLLKQKHD